MEKITKLACLVLLVACSRNASASFMHHTDTADDNSHHNRFSIDVDAIFNEIELSQWVPREHSDGIKKEKNHSWSSKWMDDGDFFTNKHPGLDKRHFEPKWHGSGGHHPNIDFRHHHGHIPAIPLPAAVWLFGSGLIGLIAFARKKA